MRLLEVRLSDWRQFRGGPYTIRFHERGTVLAGPNEAGKSTVFEAIRRALFDRARTSSAWVERMAPWGTSGAMPSVALRFEHDGVAWDVDKRFGPRGESRLRQLEGTDVASEAHGEEADEKLLALLGAEADRSRGGSQPGSWGAFQWLFVPQGDRDLPGAETEPTRHLGLEQAGVSADFLRVRVLVEGRYERTYTPTGRVARNSGLQQTESRLEELRERRRDLEEKLRARDEQCRRYDEIREALPRAVAEAEQARKAWTRTQEEQVDLSGIRERAKAEAAARVHREDELRRAEQTLKERRRREAEADEAQKTSARARDALAEARAAGAGKEQETADARKRTDELRRRIEDDRKHADSLGRVLRRREAEARAKEIEKKLKRVRELDDDIVAVRAACLDEPPSEKLVDRIDRMATETQVARAEAKRSALRVSKEGSPDVEIEVDGRPFEGTEGTALDAVIVRPPSGGTVRVEGDTESARRSLEKAADLEAEIRQLLEPFGAEDPAALRLLRGKQIALRHKLDALERERAAVDPCPAGEIMEELERLRQELAAIDGRTSPEERAAYQSWPTERLSAEHGRIAASLEQQGAELKESQHVRDGFERLLADARTATQDAELAFENARTKAEQFARELDRHRDECGSSEACEIAAQNARQAWEHAAVEAKKLKDQLQRLEFDAEARRETARTRLERLDQRSSDLRAEAELLEGLLERVAASGIYSRLADTEAAVASEEARLERLRGEGEAVRLLREVMDEVRGTVVRRVVAPIREDLEVRLGSATVGRYTLAELDEDLRPVSLGGGERCEYDDGSEGLRELVAVLLRMSVAAHLAETQPQTLILDDPCVHVSAERVERVVSQIRQLIDGGRVQVIVLTHRPADFAGLSEGWVDMQTLRSTTGRPAVKTAADAGRAGQEDAEPPAEPDAAYERIRCVLEERGVIASRDAQALLGLGAADVRPLLQRLVDDGLAEAEGERRGRRYRRRV